VPGIASRLKCRGQVIGTTQTVSYEVALKEFGFRPEPYAIADALMYADGKPIVEIIDMSLRMTGLSRERLAAIWKNAASARESQPPTVPDVTPPHRQPALFDTDRILAFAIGKPSEAFGDRYCVFDSERVIARLPGPPYQFLDRITAIDAEPWKMVAGGTVEAEYDVPPDAWYFAANRCPLMPFSILLEVALQPCGWLAAYLGSALTSPEDLSFRNLGGKATQFAMVGPDARTLTTRVKITRVSQSAGMIIQHYDLAVSCRDRLVYSGSTYFGFFSKAALANQVGMRDATLMECPFELAQSKEFPAARPFPDTMMRMVDRVSWYDARGGTNGLGAIEGAITVDPEAWFFKAHFHQDPVWPGSLGLESFLQLLKYVAAQRWGSDRTAGWQAVAPRYVHEWIYRGQVIPTDREVTVQAVLRAADDTARLLKADGYLSVDGRIIYQMKDFTLQG
jgi:3-hydroxymyristoyl/3-hydroxydecanoyl-(acyl carrier protein) dehydratase